MTLRKIRVVNDDPNGNPLFTRVYNGETGELIRNVLDVEIRASRDMLVTILHLVCQVEYDGVVTTQVLYAENEDTQTYDEVTR